MPAMEKWLKDAPAAHGVILSCGQMLNNKEVVKIIYLCI